MSTAEDAQPEPESPEAIRADIDETRAELGDTVEALAHKSDVKGRAEERIAGIKQDARAKAEQLKRKASNVLPLLGARATGTWPGHERPEKD